jgi:hypothetical protein
VLLPLQRVTGTGLKKQGLHRPREVYRSRSVLLKFRDQLLRQLGEVFEITAVSVSQGFFAGRVEYHNLLLNTTPIQIQLKFEAGVVCMIERVAIGWPIVRQSSAVPGIGARLRPRTQKNGSRVTLPKSLDVSPLTIYYLADSSFG